MLKGVIDLVRVKLVALSHTFTEEVISALLRENGDFVCRNGVDMVCESKLSLDYRLAFLAHIYALSK